METASLASRRRFLLHAAGLLAASPTLSSGVLAQDAQPQALVAGNHNLFRVRIEMNVEGNVHVPKNPLVSRQTAARLPIKSEAVFDYEERYVRSGAAVEAIERYYHEASSQVRANRSEMSLQLRSSVRDTMVSRSSLPEVIYATEDYFYRDELELLRVPASSSALDQLLPSDAISVGSEYQPSRAILASLLNLTSVEASDVTVSVLSMTEQDVKFQLNGKVDGSVDGVPTTLRLIGKLTFDRRAQTCTWLAMGLHETREISTAEPGFDVAATIKMIRKPLDQTIALPAEPRSVPALAPEDRLYVDIRSKELGISGLMDRRWRMMSDLPGSAMMRMIDRDRSIAQCDFRSLVALEPGVQMTLEAFGNDVRQTLGEQLSEFVEAEELQTDQGITVLRVTANGAVQGVPIHWIMLHFSNESGRRILATFTMEGDRRAIFAGADAQLASSLRFLRTSEPAGESNATAASGSEDLSPADDEVAAKFGERREAQVQSKRELK